MKVMIKAQQNSDVDNTQCVDDNRKSRKLTVDYRNGGEGFGKWVEDNVCLSIYPPGSDIAVWTPVKDLPDEEDEYGRSYRKLWKQQLDVCYRALEMTNGKFIHRLIIFCWMRGEGKSILACLIQLWKFFNWPKQQIMLGANSKEQVKFVHYDIKRDIIINSPRLLRVIGRRNIQQKEIHFTNAKKNVVSQIRSISSFTGIVSNITGYTFSEMFDMKNPSFFVQLDGSIRNIPNALGVIDSTVSDKKHILYQMFKNRHDIKTLFFSYRFSKEGDPRDYWNPMMTEAQLNDYRIKFPFGEFERYFLNLWSAGNEKVFTQDIVDAIQYFGIKGSLNSQEKVLELLQNRIRLVDEAQDLSSRGLDYAVDTSVKVEEIDKQLWSVESVYALRTPQKVSKSAEVMDLEKLGDMYDTDWAILAGLDRADPMKRNRTAARTIYTLVAKGLPGSRTNPFYYDADHAVPHYIYVLLHLVDIHDHSLEALKRLLKAAQLEFDGIDMFSGERWGLWDMQEWCTQEDIPIETVWPTYDRQKDAFTELYIVCKTGRFKAPPLAVQGSKSEDILREEIKIFDHDIERRWFGSPEKDMKYGVQDDAMYSLAWCIFGGKNFTIDDFRPRRGRPFFGMFVDASGKVISQ